MGQLRSACRALLLHFRRPAEVLAGLDAFARHIDGARCTTVLCALVDGDVVRYSSAGHVPAVVVHPDGRHHFLEEGRSVPLGTLMVEHRPEATIGLERGSTLLLYTDGLVERRAESLDAGLERLGRTVVDHRLLDGDALIERAMDELLPDGRHADDIAVVVYRHRAGTPTFTVSVPADANELAPLRHSLRRWLRDTGADEQTVADVLIAVGEACTNSMEHAYRFSPGRRLHVVAQVVDATLEVVVADEGPWQPPAPPDLRRGRGLPIMRTLMDDMAITRDGTGTTVRMIKRLTGAA
jgi:anti-sigma regulatory factor (Ser/Thr protein kinase)